MPPIRSLSFPRRAAAAFGFLLLAVASTGCNGCQGGGSAAPGASGQAAASSKARARAAAAVIDPTRPPLVGALEALQVRDDQKAKVQAIGQAITAQQAAVRTAKAKLATDIADGIRKNQIDRAALAPDIAGIKTAAVATQAGMQKSFDELHVILDPAQRKALLGAMKKEFESHRSAKGEGRFRMDELGTEVGLAPDQITTIRTKLREHMASLPPPDGQHDRRPVGQQLRAFATAFESDTFDAKSFELGAEGGAVAERGAEILIASAEVALPILTPEQRTALADKLTERAKKE